MWLDDLRAKVETRVDKGATLLVAVSGGADSVALLHGLNRHAGAFGLRLVVAHLDHALRDESAVDAAFVGDLALRLGCMALRERIDVTSWAKEEGRNVEEAARHLRYTFLDVAARAVGAAAVVVAHTLDDQAETLLMHLLRGAGLEGLAGMGELGSVPVPGSSMPLFRPLLGVRREELRHWLSEQGVEWREDHTNADTGRFRAAVRHSIMPVLEASSPGAAERVARAAELLEQDAAFMRSALDEAWRRVVTQSGDPVRLSADALHREPHALRRRILRRAAELASRNPGQLSAAHITAALAIIDAGRVGQQMSLPGGTMLTVGLGEIWIGAPAALHVWEPATLPLAGTLRVGSVAFSSESVPPDALPREWEGVGRSVAFFDLDALSLPLHVRPPRTGDRWQPLGLRGRSVLLRSWLARQKVPRQSRDVAPLLVDQEGRILWVVGWRTAHPARITPETRRVLRVEALA